MKNKIIRLSALTVGLCTAITAFSSCGGNETDTTTTTAPESTTKAVVTTTEKAVTVVNNDGQILEIASQNEMYTYYKPQTAAKKEEVSYTYNIAQSPGSDKSDSNQGGQSSDSAAGNEYINENIEEKSKGISIVAKSSSAFLGNSATVMIQGTAGKQYTLEFYEAPDVKADYDGLGTKKADENGLVSWTFNIEETCKKGNRKVYIKEKNSSNYIQTSINIQ